MLEFSHSSTADCKVDDLCVSNLRHRGSEVVEVFSSLREDHILTREHDQSVTEERQIVNSVIDKGGVGVGEGVSHLSRGELKVGEW